MSSMNLVGCCQFPCDRTKVESEQMKIRKYWRALLMRGPAAEMSWIIGEGYDVC